MSYKSIAAVVHDPAATNTHLDLAIVLAEKFDAHLHILAAGIDRTDPGFYYAGATAIAIQQNYDTAKQDAGEVDKVIRERLKSETVAWDVRTVTLTLNGLTPYLADTMRFQDLIVMPSPYQTDVDQIDQIIFDACLFRAERPVVIAPNDTSMPVDFSKVLVAWDDSAQALSAARAAEPFIQKAELTTLAMIDPPTNAPDRSDPGGQLAAYLSHHGAAIELSIQSRRQRNTAAQLLDWSMEQGIGLIVMGAYGHSRLREAVIGGATRDMLREADRPVLMAR